MPMGPEGAITVPFHLWCGAPPRAPPPALLAPIYEWFTEGFDTADLRQARALLDDLGYATS